jgi:uncharacterized membrane protein YfcA
MLLEIWRTAPDWVLVGVAGSLIIAGMLKGIIGVGMPIVALPLISMFIDVRASVMLLSVPLVLSNVPQALEGGKVLGCLKELLPVLLGMVPGILIGVFVLLAVDASIAKLIAGVVVVVIAILTMLAPKLEIKKHLQKPVGAVSGLLGGALGGLAAMPGPLVFTYLLAKGLRGKSFTKEASMFLVLSAALLAAVLTSSQAFGWSDLAVSTAALLPVAAGMVVGQKLRDRVSGEACRHAVLIVILLSGAELVRKAMLA